MSIVMDTGSEWVKFQED